jgi:superoxide reductase
MTNQKEIYKCNVCGNIVEILHAGEGELVCCEQPMQLLKENTVDAATEKHVPVFEREGNRVYVTVGSVEHPMEDKHYIEFIEVITSSKVYRKYLTPGSAPKAEFMLMEDEDVLDVREYCNLHGLWKK